MYLKEIVESYEWNVEAIVRQYYFTHNNEIKDLKSVSGRVASLRNFYWDMIDLISRDNDDNYILDKLVYTPWPSDLFQEISGYPFENHFDQTYSSCPIIGVLRYRNHEIPVYDDDYGQSVFCVYRDRKGEEHILSSGAFNVMWIGELINQLDSYFDTELIEDEIARLVERDL